MGIRSIAAVAAMSTLCACGGGETSGALGGGPSKLLPSFPAVGSGPFSLSEITSYANFPDLDLGVVPPGVPGVSSATYDGLVEIERFSGGTQTDYVGRSTLVANFAGGTLTGSSTNFIEVAGADTTTPSIVSVLGGTIPVTNGSISGSTFTADYNGNLTSGSQTLAVNSSVNGIFGTLNGQNLALGIVNGTIGPAGDSLTGLITGSQR